MTSAAVSQHNPHTKWEPNPQDLTQAVDMLQALRNPLRNDHIMALQALETNVKQPVFILHMLHVFTQGYRYEDLGLTIDIRQLAGLIIKNYVFPHLLELSQDVQFMLRQELIQVLQDSVTDLRNTAAILIGRISVCFPIPMWIDVLQSIMSGLDSQLLQTQGVVVDGCLQAMKCICEDASVKLSMDDQLRPLETLIPRLLSLLTCHETSIRLRALECYNALLKLLENNGSNAHLNLEDDQNTMFGSKSMTNHQQANASHPLIMHMNVFITSIASLSTDADAKIRRAVCESITTIACLHIALLEPYFPSICQFMLVALMDSDEDVGIEACEFWSSLLHHADTKKAMIAYLPALTESLINRLYLTKEQMDTERLEEEEENSGTREVCIKPIHHRATGDGNGHSGVSDSREEAEVSSKWTLRKQAALTLDLIGLSFPAHEILALALPKIQLCFQAADVFVKESGMLALGALSNGCAAAMMPFIPQLFPFFISNLQDTLPEMRSITCWVLGRYCRLFAEIYNQEDGDGSVMIPREQGQQFYLQTLQALLALMFDDKVKVQVATCSTLCILIDQSFYIQKLHHQEVLEVNILSDYLIIIMQHISRCFDGYGIKSTLLLIDVIGCLADTLRDDFQQQGAQITPLYLEKLMKRFERVEDQDMKLFPFLECLTSLLAVIGLEAKDYIPMVYQRCLRLLQKSLHPSLRANQDDNEEDDNGMLHIDYAICALDVISALSEGLGSSFYSLIASTHTHLIQYMFWAMNYAHFPELKQSAFSLSGEICKVTGADDQKSQLFNADLIHQLLTICIMNMDVHYPLVCNNAAWTVGELVMRFDQDPKYLRPHTAKLIAVLTEALQSTEVQDHLKVNMAVTIGRVGRICAIEVAEVADEFFGDWCR